jgi:serine phosphatase RsbU (regulator of sigma subunit)
MAGDDVAMACLEVWGGNEPVDTGVKVPGLDVWVYAVPFGNAAAGGDVHFVSSCGTGRIARLVVADVAGHGEGVAETARVLRGLIRRFMNHIDQRKFVSAMNERFSSMVEAGKSEGAGFATAVVMTYFSPGSELSVCNAGHPLPLLYRKGKGTWEYISADGEEKEGNFPLGIVGDSGYEEFRLVLEKGDLVLCYTDSLVEAVCRDGTLFGTQRLLELVRGMDVGEGTHLIHEVVAKMAVAGAVFNDDVTMVLSRCGGRSGGAGFLGRLMGQVRFVGEVLMLRRNVPWPEWSVRNLGGAVVPGLNRRR